MDYLINFKQYDLLEKVNDVGVVEAITANYDAKINSPKEIYDPNPISRKKGIEMYR